MAHEGIYLHYGHLADYAGFGANGKPILVGIFDQVYAMAKTESGAIPLPACYLAAQIRGSVVDSGAHTLEIVLRDEDGQPVYSAMKIGDFRLAPTGPGRPLTANVLIQLAGVAVPRVCDYEFAVLVDEKPIGEIPIYVVPAPARG